MKQFDSFGLDTSNECLWQNGGQIPLPPKPFAVLRYLVENPGRLVTHNELLDALWPDTFVQPQVLRTYMLELRKILGDDAKQPRFIQTVPKRGYVFVAPIADPAEKEVRLVAQAAALVPDRAAIVDRKEELQRLNELAQLAASGQRQTAFIAGETGIGKTALVDAFTHHVHSVHPVIVARGQCVSGFGKEDYYPVMEALGQLCSLQDTDSACAVLARVAPGWIAALGRDPAVLTQLSARPSPAERQLADLCAALEELASERLLILVFEDLHWADSSTLDLVSALARRRAPARLLLVGTCRPFGAAAEHPLKELKQDLRLRRLSSDIALHPLTKSAMQDLLRKELGQDSLPEGLAGFVHQRSEGNPLFAIAILGHLIAQSFLVREGEGAAAQWRQSALFEEMEAGVPEELAQMIELEIDRLGALEQRILEAGSLFSVAFPAWAVAAALDEEAAAIEETCDQLARRLHFVHRAGQDELPDGSHSAFYVFAHDLFREVLHRRQPPTRRATMHVRVANRLGELFAGRESDVAREIAMHFESAAEWQHAIKALRAAARHARRRNAHAEADELLQRALHLSANLRDPARSSLAQELQVDLASQDEVSAIADR